MRRRRCARGYRAVDRANDSYDAAQDLRRGADILELEAPLSAAGFEVIVVDERPGRGHARREKRVGAGSRRTRPSGC